MTSAARRLTASLLTLGLLISPAAWSPSVAEEPLDVTGPVTDEAGVLSDADHQRIDEALKTFYDDTQRQLFVVYVDSFEGTTGAEWAEHTALESGLGSADLLVAVATQQRAYGFSVPDDISETDLERVDQDHVLPALRRSAWADAAVAAAEGFTEVEQGVDVPWRLVAVGGAVVIGIAGFAVLRTRRRYDRTHHVRDEHGNLVDPADILTDAELEQHASTALVGIDDALRTSEQELRFAETQLGPETTRPFRTALDDGRERAREAFALQQMLDDADLETDEERRQLTSRIITICEEVDAALDALVDDFDRVRDLEGSAAQALDAVADRIAATHGTLPAARETWQRLQAAHAEAALSVVAANVEQAETLLGAAHEAVGRGRADLTDDVPAAGMHLRVAESATAQAETLLTAVTSLETALAADTDADPAGRVSARADAVSAFVETHRGAVGPQARTRLHEADRLLGIARSSVAADPDVARSRLERAGQLLEEAHQSADADVAHWRAEHAGAEESGASGAATDSLLLGGILIDRSRSTTSRGSGRRGSAPASSFGGSSRRGRRSATSSRGRPRGGKF
ncbi:TPM domain-containing protein [Aeromicrobium sp. CTD01-1L150]|uniref:TPM domain-containing protein n=1 Tax=Aeromicrobium sp. CTD01-1L150 TaxID=3341830 RepID=UPI0035C23B1A